MAPRGNGTYPGEDTPIELQAGVTMTWMRQFFLFLGVSVSDIGENSGVGHQVDPI